MKIRQDGKIRDVYFLVSVAVVGTDGKWIPWRRLITKEPNIEGIREHVPEFPDFGDLSTPGFNYVKEIDGLVYSIQPFDSCDLS